MEKQVLSIEQMKRLIELGIDTSKASVANVSAIVNPSADVEQGDACMEFFIGGTSSDMRLTLQDVLNAMPYIVKAKGCYRSETDYTMSIDASRNKEYTVFLKYEENSDYDVLVNFSSENLLDAAYQMLCWCAENGHFNEGWKWVK